MSRSGSVAALVVALVVIVGIPGRSVAQPPSALDQQLISVLQAHDFQGKEGFKLQTRLGREFDIRRVEIGRSLFFDTILSLKNDNSCSGCHAPLAGFGDSQSIAIGVDNNNVVGAGRSGPRNMRRTPNLLNVGLYPRLMWNTRFNALSNDPFDGSRGFEFPFPENTVKFAAFDEYVKHLLAAQGHIPSTEFQEMAGFANTEGKTFRVSRLNGNVVTVLNSQITALQRVLAFDKALAEQKSQPARTAGTLVPDADASKTPNEPIRRIVIDRIQNDPNYRRAFQAAFPEVKDRTDINFAMIGATIAEWELTLDFADAPIDQFARGIRTAMTEAEKKGALVFFGSGNCVACHAVRGRAKEMFSDFENHAIGIPPLLSSTNNMPDGNFKGPNKNEDFGREDITELPGDRYKFRTSPLRNVGLQPTFFHNGAFTKLEDAIRHHLNVEQSLQNYDRVKAGVAADIDQMGPVAPVLAAVDLLLTPISLSPEEFSDLVIFVQTGLTDRRATKETLCGHIPTFVLSGRTMHNFEGCQPN